MYGTGWKATFDPGEYSAAVLGAHPEVLEQRARFEVGILSATSW